MRLRTRLVLLVGTSITVGMIAVAAILTWSSWHAIRTQAELEGRDIARLIAQSVSVSEQVSADLASLLDQEMIAQGVLLSHLADLADAAAIPDRMLSRRLAEVTARSTISELWVSDATGRVRATSAEESAIGEPLAAMAGVSGRGLTRLLDGTDFARPMGIGRQPLGGLPMRHVGVRGIDHPRAVLIGREERDLAHLADTLGVPRLLEAVLRGGAIEAVWVFGPDGRLVAGARADRGDASAAALSEAERALVTAVLDGTPAHGRLAPGWISVAAAMPDQYGIAAGVTLARLSIAPFHALLADALRLGGGVSLLALILGLGVSVVMGRRMADPVLRIAEAAGAVDAHRFVPGTLAPVARRHDELGHLARTFETMAIQVMAREEELEAQVRARTAELQRKNAELEEARRRLEADLELAKLLQATILPQSFPPGRGWTGSAMMTPALQMAGDFYDYFALDTHRTGLVIADVSGKGVAPAFFMAVSRAALQEAAGREADPGACLAAANDRLCGQNPLEMFVTVFYAVIDARDGRVVYANGGHNPPYLVPMDGPAEQLALTGGMMLGVMPGLPYAAATRTLAAGETLFLYTDGVTEAMNPANEEFGEERLAAVLERTRGQPVAAILDAVTAAVRDFAAGAPQSDDITCLVVRYTGTGLAIAP